MLDAFKSKSGATKVQADELQTLIAASKEERAALSTMLTQVQLTSAKLSSASKTLQEVEEKSGKAHAKLDEVTDRLNKAAGRAKELEAIDARIKALTSSGHAGRKGSRPPDGPRRRAAEAQAGAPERLVPGAADAGQP